MAVARTLKRRTIDVVNRGNGWNGKWRERSIASERVTEAILFDLFAVEYILYG